MDRISVPCCRGRYLGRLEQAGIYTFVRSRWKILRKAVGSASNCARHSVAPGTGYGQVAAATLVRDQVPAPDGWTKTFTDPRLCAARVDRLIFNGAIIEAGTDSYRLVGTRARVEESV